MRKTKLRLAAIALAAAGMLAISIPPIARAVSKPSDQAYCDSVAKGTPLGDPNHDFGGKACTNPLTQ